MKKIFISHSSKDKNTAEEFIDLLTSGLGISINEIFCTSTDGARIELGEPWREMIKKNIESAIIVFFIVSNDFKLSQICQNELGAAWIIENKKILPLILYPIMPETTGELLNGLQAARLSHSADMESVKTKIQRELSATSITTNYNDVMWASKKEKFIENIKIIERNKRKATRWNHIKELIKKTLMWSSISIPILLYAYFYQLSINKELEKRKRIYKATSDIHRFDLKLELISKELSSPNILANNLEEAIPYIKDISSKSSTQYNIELDFSQLHLNADSIDVLFSKTTTIILDAKIADEKVSKGLQDFSIPTWRKIELSGDEERKLDRFRHSADESLTIILNIRQ